MLTDVLPVCLRRVFSLLFSNYTLAVNRRPPDMSQSLFAIQPYAEQGPPPPLVLSPLFQSSLYSYSTSVPFVHVGFTISTPLNSGVTVPITLTGPSPTQTGYIPDTLPSVVFKYNGVGTYNLQINNTRDGSAERRADSTCAPPFCDHRCSSRVLFCVCLLSASSVCTTSLSLVWLLM
jgi:hypothetical protein